METLTETALEILSHLRLRSAMRFPYLSNAFGILTCIPDMSLPDLFSTDGISLYFSPRQVCLSYRKSPDTVFHAWCHLHMHCLCFHMFYPPDCDPDLWDLACDIFSEHLLENPDAAKLCQNTVWASDVCHFLEEKTDPGERAALAASFRQDSHRYWRSSSRKDPGNDSDRVLKLWSSVSAKHRQSISDGLGMAGEKSGSLSQEVVLSSRQKCYDYRKFLTRFMTSREEILLDPDSFDYIPYLYGLSHYQNMPLIEPLEYCEVNRLDEIAIAIDTSGSCPVPIVKRFLEETLNILEQKGNFFRKMRVHFIQCDSVIQDYRIFTCKEDWNDYLSNVTVFGQGNTDFCPVFSLLEQKIKKQEIKKLRALLYFTDGDGIFPSAKPDFETAFIFLNRELEKRRIPSWAIRLNLELSDLPSGR